jgi:hypothetical protein
MLAESHFVALTAWKAATNVAERAALSRKLEALGRLIMNMKWW